MPAVVPIKRSKTNTNTSQTTKRLKINPPKQHSRNGSQPKLSNSRVNTDDEDDDIPQEHHPRQGGKSLPKPAASTPPQADQVNIYNFMLGFQTGRQIQNGFQNRAMGGERENGGIKRPDAGRYS